MNVIVMAKEPRPGSVKTRLCPPCTPEEAARIAEAALRDTLDAATASAADEVIVALDGQPGSWCPPGVRVIPQVSGTFGQRLGAAWETIGGPAIQIGMDTPQVTPAALNRAMGALSEPPVDAILGFAADGGWWILGLNTANAAVFDGVAMSRNDTGAQQHQRLDTLGMNVVEVETMTDVDVWDAALAVASAAPWTRFAVAVRSIEATPPTQSTPPIQSTPGGQR